MSFTVQQEVYAGPLEVLLDLVEQEQLDISRVSLQAVALAYLNYLEHTPVPAEELADFLLIATRLIYLKSYALLPDPPSEEANDEAPLEDQLRAYRVVRKMMRLLESHYGADVCHPRPLPKRTIKLLASCPPNVSSRSLQETYNDVLKKLAPFLALRQAHVSRTVSVAQRVAHLRGLLESRSRLRWSDVIAASHEPAEIVVSFLALLDVYREGRLIIDQSNPFADITISYARPT